jgi:hypothetical protein
VGGLSPAEAFGLFEPGPSDLVPEPLVSAVLPPAADGAVVSVCALGGFDGEFAGPDSAFAGVVG